MTVVVGAIRLKDIVKRVGGWGWWGFRGISCSRLVKLNLSLKSFDLPFMSPCFTTTPHPLLITRTHTQTTTDDDEDVLDGAV
jgi:hypothetical protein